MAVLVLLLLLCGCSSYTHERVGIEKTRAISFFTKAANIQGETTDATNTYNRKLSIGSLTGDSKTLEVIVRAAVSEALKKPSLPVQ